MHYFEEKIKLRLGIRIVNGLDLVPLNEKVKFVRTIV